MWEVWQVWQVWGDGEMGRWGDGESDEQRLWLPRGFEGADACLITQLLQRKLPLNRY
ncbi:MAG: hypothetical protein F6J90_15485 [Moorea sp. SIOASIH]|uniref:hypothetical protein n=1 Tax=Moorena sp. SIOASIH TaxID=2607817 RepID=UPI0013B6E99F|nr:hypothetical protein [Moorena sp. SIOASIH]NEO37655.1 hypothetical protein [Moorena sp. SIOASIH]